MKTAHASKECLINIIRNVREVGSRIGIDGTAGIARAARRLALS